MLLLLVVLGVISAKPVTNVKPEPVVTPVVPVAPEPEAESCGEQCDCGSESACGACSAPAPSIKILYTTRSGTAEKFALELAGRIGYDKAQVVDLAKYDPETLPYEQTVIFLLPSYTGGLPLATTKHFHDWMKENSDERGGNTLRTVKVAVFGLGNKEYAEYNRVAQEAFRQLYQMGATLLCTLGDGDESGEQGLMFTSWCDTLLATLQSGQPSAVVALEESDEEGEPEEPLVDMEELGPQLKPKPADEKPEFGKPMLSALQKQTLSKQGYKVIGSHSSVKMCRWTKAMLRGLGGCYKHTFYGIQSHQCMEMTPSMACANKCVFCWRHHKNPVGKEWRWEMDPPEMLVAKGLENHYKMINEYKGAKGVQPDRVAEGFNVKHCALSLVGEPVLYPEINPFLDLLHGKGISSFMVTNAQFPDLIATLRPVTQLYLSIDAATPETLKKIDRPLFEDYWERFLGSIDALREKGQRTVFRLTLVKGYNTEEIKNYASLIRRGRPDFIEIKGVTFCGGGKRAELNMSNVPWHDEVIQWSRLLCTEVEDTYELACEHEHSCCLLLANTEKFKIDGKWHTFIDFDKFIELQAAGQPFTALDYMKPTPAWAVWGAKERGFDPNEQRVRRKGKNRDSQTSEASETEEEYQVGGC